MGDFSAVEEKEGCEGPPLDYENENYYRYWVDDANAKPKQLPARLAQPQPQAVSSETLLGRAQELRILHAGREYRLRRTRNGRLILTA